MPSNRPSAPCAPARRLDDVRYEIRGDLSPARRRTRGRRPRHRQAQHRQSGPVRLQRAEPPARGDPANLRRAARRYCHQQGLAEARAGDRRAARRMARAPRIGAHIHRQRRQRADRPQPARAARSGRRSAAARRRTIRCGARPTQAERRQAGLLPVSGRTRAPARSGRNRSTDHAAHARAGDHQSEQPDRCGVSARSCSKRLVASPQRHGLVLLCDEIYDRCCTTTHRSCRWRRSPATSVPDARRLVQGAPRLRLPRRLAVADRRRRRTERDRACASTCSRRCACAANVTGAMGDQARAAGPNAIARADRARRAPARGARARSAKACERANYSTWSRRAARCTRSPASTRAPAGFRRRRIRAGPARARKRCWSCPGPSFNIAARNHFRVTLLPEPAVLREVFVRIERCSRARRQRRTGAQSAVA